MQVEAKRKIEGDDRKELVWGIIENQPKLHRYKNIIREAVAFYYNLKNKIKNKLSFPTFPHMSCCKDLFLNELTLTTFIKGLQ